MKKIYIHIGFGKTGTTAIQSFFSKRRAALLEQGFLYPETGLQIGGHHLLAPLDANNISGNVKSLYEQLAKEIHESSAKNIFISSENFIFAKPNFIENVKNEFAHFDVGIIFYARSQEALIESVFLQWQKVGDDYQGNIEGFFKKHKFGFDFLKKIEPWDTQFGEECIIARLYERKLIGDDICRDIASVLGLEGIKFLSGEKENFSLRPEFSALVNLIDSTGVEAGVRTNIINELLRLSERFDSVKRERLIKPDLGNEIAMFYKESNLEFANKYLEPAHADYLCNKV